MKIKIMSKLFVVLFTIFLSMPLLAQDNVPPPPPENASNGGGPVGGGAPIGGGLAILIAMGAAYGGKKMYDMNKKKLAE